MYMQAKVQIGLFYLVKEMKLFLFYSFDVGYVREEIKKFIGSKNIKAKIFPLQGNNSIMCSYFCIGFIDSFLQVKN